MCTFVPFYKTATIMSRTAFGPQHLARLVKLRMTLWAGRYCVNTWNGFTVWLWKLLVVYSGPLSLRYSRCSIWQAELSGLVYNAATVQEWLKCLHEAESSTLRKIPDPMVCRLRRLSVWLLLSMLDLHTPAASHLSVRLNWPSNLTWEKGKSPVSPTWKQFS